MLRGLERLPADRFAAVGDFTAALTTPSFRYGEYDASGVQLSSRVLVMGLAATSLLFAGVAGWALTGSEAPQTTDRWYIDFQAGQVPLQRISRLRFALSPDGDRIVYVGPPPVPSDGVRSALWLLERGRLEATPISGTENAENPAFSPDGTRLAFVVHLAPASELRAGPIGGPYPLLTDSVVDRGGVSWGYDGFIYYDAHLEGDGLARIPEGGGAPERATVPGPDELWHSAPRALPGGRGVLFYAAGVDSVGVLDVATGDRRFLTDGYGAIYAESGHLLWVRADGTMMAAGFDQDRLELVGEAIPLVSNVPVAQWGGWNATIASDGTLLHTVGDAGEEQYALTWLLGDGTRTPFATQLDANVGRFGLDARSGRVALITGEVEDGRHVWVVADDGSPPRRVTSGQTHRFPGWTDDGEYLVYLAHPDSGGPLDMVVRDPDAVGQGRVVLPASFRLPTGGWALSPGNDWLVVADAREPYALRLGDDFRPTGERLELDFNPAAGNRPPIVDPAFSPDGRWLAYWSEVGGTPRVEVRPFPDVDGGVWPVSDGVGFRPRWSADGDHIYFFDLDRYGITRVAVDAAPVFVAGTPEVVADLSQELDVTSNFAVDPTGRILFRERIGGEDRTVLVTNVFDELRERVPGSGR